MCCAQGKAVAVLVVALVIARTVTWNGWVYHPPAHLKGHTALYLPDLLSVEEANGLMAIAKTFGRFPTNNDDTLAYSPQHEHVGEAMPIGDDGLCAHPYMIPSKDRQMCHLAGRIDVGRHFIMTGGLPGLKEFHQDLVTRVLSFGRYIFTPEDYPVINQLFQGAKFQAAASSICPDDKQHLDPFQFNLIVQLPGQTVPTHLDAPYFWGASRFQFPQWLLVCMVFSGLFQDKFIDQVQVVAYFHEWEATEERAGSFKHWARDLGYPEVSSANARAGSAVDGSKVVHAGDVYMLGQRPPRLDKSAKNALVYQGDDSSESWLLESNNVTKGTYTTDDLRWTVVYRARCFASEGEAARYHAGLPDDEMITLESVLDTLHADLVTKGVLQSGDAPDRLELALLLLDTYIKYPLPPDAVLPLNPCAAAAALPWLEPILAPFC